MSLLSPCEMEAAAQHPRSELPGPCSVTHFAAKHGSAEGQLLPAAPRAPGASTARRVSSQPSEEFTAALADIEGERPWWVIPCDCENSARSAQRGFTEIRGAAAAWRGGGPCITQPPPACRESERSRKRLEMHIP